MITSLTKAQEARYSEFSNKWIKIGLCTEPANRIAAEAAMNKIYKANNLAAPQFVWCGSPISLLLTYAAYESFSDEELENLDVLKILKQKTKLAAKLVDSCRQLISGVSQGLLYGQLNADYFAFYDYMREVVGLKKETEPLVNFMAHAQSAGWTLPGEKICFLAERPLTLHRDARGRLHNTSGPAMKYPDGWGVYAVHGVLMPSDIIDDNSLLTPKRIDEEKNQEVRRVMVELFGAAKYLQTGGMEEVSKDEYGTLYRKSFLNNESLMMVKVLDASPDEDGTIKSYFLRVHPELRPLLPNGRLGNSQTLTPKNAIASTFQQYGVDYGPDIET